MYKKYKISVSVPAYNEEKLIRKTLETIPKFVDLIVAVDDKSKDKTIDEIRQSQRKDKRIQLISSEKNLGLGDTVVRAHNYAVKKNMDIVVVMAGDNQMDPKYLPLLLDTIIEDNYDYAKGNRFFHREALKKMTRFRLIGNILLSFLSKFSTGYWSISDPINGYTALKVKIFKKIDITQIGSRYGFEPSLLIELSLINARVKDVFIPARYGTEKSKVNLLRDPFKVVKVFLQGFARRIFYKYTIFNFHPIALFYGAGCLFILISLMCGLYVMLNSIILHEASIIGGVMLFIVLFILGVQLILQAIVLDIQSEPK